MNEEEFEEMEQAERDKHDEKVRELEWSSSEKPNKRGKEMSQKKEKLKRYVIKEIKRNALEHYNRLSFFEKLRWHFNKSAYIEWYFYNTKNYYSILR